MEYVQLVSYLGELYRDLEQPLEAIDALERSVSLHESACEMHAESLEADKDQLVMERTGILKMLAEEEVKAGQITEGI